jgi:hypothetical protein
MYVASNFSDVLAVLPVGVNGKALTVDAYQDYFLAWSGTLNETQIAAGKNAVINGAFDVWQRGTSFSISNVNSTYTADRWTAYRGTPLATGLTVSRQVTGDTTNLANIQYCARMSRDSGNTSTSVINLLHNIETSNSILFAGQTMTLSFYARSGANYSSSSSALLARIVSGTGTDQNYAISPAGWSGGVVVSDSTVTLTTTWQRFTGTGTVDATATQIAVRFSYPPTGTAGANDYFEITGVQLEVGSTATSFSRNGVSIQGELAACQRYYYRLFPGAVSEQLGIISIQLGGTGTAILTGQFPVKMRTTPTALEQSGTANQYGIVTGVTSIALTAVPTYSALTTTDSYVVSLATASGTAGQGGRLQTDATNGAAAYLGWSAEL